MRVGAVLDGRPDSYDQIDDAANRKATDDARRIIAKVETLALGLNTMNQKLIEHKTEIVEHVDAVGAKVEETAVARRVLRRVAVECAGVGAETGCAGEAVNVTFLRII